MPGFGRRFLIAFSFAFYLLFISGFIGSAQTNLSALRKQKAQNERDIAYTNSLLKNTLKNHEFNLSRLILLKQKIKSREGLINSIEREIAAVDSRILNTRKEISSHEAYLAKLKKHYAKCIYYANKHRNSYEKLMFIFSSKDFNQAYRRLKYLQQYSNFTTLQGKEIIATRDSLNGKLKLLNNSRQEKKDLLSQKTEETLQLSQEKNQHTKVITQLQKKERKLRKELANQQKVAKRLQKSIQKIIKREAELAAKKKAGSGKFSLTPEEKLVSDSFGKNKGTLPWPTRTGFISEYFGEHPHPILKHVKVRNDGINITTEPHSACLSVFQGTVTHILPMPGLNTVVIIRHGEFFSVYSNLTAVTIKKGEQVAAKQKIGTVYTNNSKGETVLKFQLWKGSTKLNPAKWLTHN
jgi:septal ring factor EnvC (AmiA/AmiB activator)